MSSSPDDLTPLSGSPTDVAPLGQHQPLPPHEQGAGETRGAINWEAMAELPAFRDLLRDKLRFITPTTVFFLVYYFALLILVGWWPDLMDRKIAGINYAYLFALSQFFMAWLVAALYVAKAVGWDKKAAAILSQFGHRS